MLSMGARRAGPERSGLGGLWGKLEQMGGDGTPPCLHVIVVLLESWPRVGITSQFSREAGSYSYLKSPGF